MKQDPAWLKKYDLSSLRYLFLAGDPLDEPTSRWISDGLGVYGAIRQDGHQKNAVAAMQTRMVLYDHLGYHAFEQKLDALFKEGK